MTTVFFSWDESGKAASQRALAAALADRGVPPDAPMAKTVLGKPYLPDWPGVQFNLSHSGGWGACAVSDAPVGVDAELVRPLRQSVAKRFFTPTEGQYLASKSPEEFFRLWTRKESFIKALGKGFSLPLDSFSVLDDVLYRDAIAWYFWEYPVDGGFLTVCCRDTEAEFRRL